MGSSDEGRHEHDCCMDAPPTLLIGVHIRTAAFVPSTQKSARRDFARLTMKEGTEVANRHLTEYDLSNRSGYDFR